MLRPIHCILLIDDDPDDNYLHKLVIDESGLCDTVRIVENGLQGLDYLTHPNWPDYVRPDLILLDINMPGINGFEFLERYSQLNESLRSRLVLLMLTTTLSPVDSKRLPPLGEIKGGLSKPLTLAALQQIVDTYFTTSKKISQRQA